MINITFDEVIKIGLSDEDIPQHADLIDMYAIQSIKYINFLYQRKVISREKATKEKNLLKASFEYEKCEAEKLRSMYAFFQDNIKRFGEIRNNLNKASANQNIDKQLWLEAIECIGLVCGEMTSYRCCERYFNGFESEV